MNTPVGRSPLAVVVVLCVVASTVLALDTSTGPKGSNADAVNGTYDGTGIRVGILDTSNTIRDAHEAFDGRASSATFGGTVGLTWHPTAVAGIVGSEGWTGHATKTGVAPDATIYGAHVGGGTYQSLFSNMRDAILIFSDADDSDGFSGARVFLTVFELLDTANGNSQYSLLYDYLARNDNLVFANAAGNQGASGVTIMGDAYNGITVGGLRENGTTGVYDQVGTSSGIGLTGGRRKPDLVAPTEDQLTADSGSDTAAREVGNTSGQTSYSTPHVAGAAAVLLDAASTKSDTTERAHAEHHLTVKSVLINEANKSIKSVSGDDTSGDAWHTDRGYGKVDVAASVDLLLQDEVAPSGTATQAGWALQVLAPSASHEYNIELLADDSFTASLAWDRIVSWVDADPPGPTPPNGVIDYGELSDGGLMNLDLELLQGTTVIAFSLSTIDNLEHIYLQAAAGGSYTLRVTNLGGSAETYAVAFHAVPEPTTICLLALGGAVVLAKRRRRR